MERKIITIHECLRMSEQELNDFIDNDKKLLSEGIGNRNQSNVDFCGLTIKDIAEKCGDTPMNEVFNNLFAKLTRQ